MSDDQKPRLKFKANLPEKVKLKKQIDHDIRNSIIAEKIGLVGDSIFSIIPDSFTGHELSLEEERILNNPNLDRNQVSFEESLYVLTGFINKLINAHKIETINGVRILE